MRNIVVNRCIGFEKESAWTFLLEKENESIFLFPFWRYLEHLNGRVYCCLKNIRNMISEQSLRVIIASNMSIVLLDLVKRTLVWEFNLSKKNNVDITVNNFLRNISTEQQLITLFNKYPVLDRLLEKIINNYLVYILGFMNRLTLDYPDLTVTLKFEDFELQSFNIKGDSHCLGERVSEVLFQHQRTKEVKKIIYKPRDLYLEKCFNDFIQFLKIKNPHIILKTIVVIPKDKYGWMEYVNQEPTEVVGAKEYYHNLGLLLGICSVFNGQDIHFENVIASGSNPIIIDLECLFSPPIIERQYVDHDFPSVFDTLLIPFKRNEKSPIYDFSAVLNHSNQKSFMHRFEVKGDFLYTVYIERTNVNIIPTNNVLIDKSTGIPFSASNFSLIIAGAYRDYLDWVIANKEDLIDFITKNFSNLKNRAERARGNETNSVLN